MQSWTQSADGHRYGGWDTEATQFLTAWISTTYLTVELLGLSLHSGHTCCKCGWNSGHMEELPVRETTGTLEPQSFGSHWFVSLFIRTFHLLATCTAWVNGSHSFNRSTQGNMNIFHVLSEAALYSRVTDLHVLSLKYQFSSSSWGFSWKEERWSASQGCPQTYGSYLFPLVQSSHGPRPSERWSGTFSFLCSKDRKQSWSQRYFILL